MANVGSAIGVLETREVQATARKLGLEAATSEIRQAEDITPAFDTLKSRAEALYVVRSPLLTDSVEKVSKMKLWNQSLKQSNPSKWSFESMLLVRRSP